AEIDRRQLLFLGARGRDRDQRLQLPQPAVINDEQPDAVAAQLGELVAKAQSEGPVIALGAPTEATLNTLAQVLPEGRPRGVRRRWRWYRCRRWRRRSTCPPAERFVESAAMQELLGIAQPIPVLSVTDLNRLVRATLETDFAEVWVAGEISNFRVPASGHFYFCLKDKRSQLAAVMFRTAQRGLAFRPSDGLDVLAHGRISLYEARGDLQLVVDTLEPRGQGGQQLALEQLKRRLAAEGLFDAARKRRLPVWPRAVGVITAMTGAAIHDIVSTLPSRMPHTRIIVRPVRVQGPYAGAAIVRALAGLTTVAP